MQTSLNTMQKIALLLVSLGPDRAAQIMAHLDQEQITRIVREIALLGKVPNGTKRAVLREFRSLVAAEEERAQSVSFAEQVLDQALGEEKARDMLRKITPAAPSAPPVPGPPYPQPCRRADRRRAGAHHRAAAGIADAGEGRRHPGVPAGAGAGAGGDATGHHHASHAGAAQAIGAGGGCQSPTLSV